MATRRVALVVGIERYQDPKISPVQFAGHDAERMAEALDAAGSEVTEILQDERATKASIESHFRRLTQSLGSDDQLAFFYAGHGFSRNDSNYLTAHDSQVGDLTHTSVSLQGLFDEVRKAATERVMFFLDACQTGMQVDERMRDVIASLSETELEEFFRAAEYQVCFASCKQSESSYSSPALKHGIWTYHLLECLCGHVPEVLESGHLLTASNLQNHLALAVPQTMRRTFEPLYTQTPWLFGGRTGDFVVADLSTIMLQREAQTESGGVDYTRAVLRGREEWKVKELAGFDKHRHYRPYKVDDASRDFVVNCAVDDLTHLVNEVHGRIQTHFSFRRNQVVVDLHDDSGSGTIETPEFMFTVAVAIDERDATRVVWTYEVSRIGNVSTVKDRPFQQVFKGMLTEVALPATKSLDVDRVIDRFESLDAEGIQLRYPHDTSSCSITLAEHPGELKVTPKEVTFSVGYAQDVQTLIGAVEDLHVAIAGIATADLLRLGPGD